MFDVGWLDAQLDQVVAEIKELPDYVMLDSGIDPKLLADLKAGVYDR